MIESYNDLYEMISAESESYMKEDDSIELTFKINDNATCELRNKQNGNKLVFMFARYGDEFKVGFAFYVADQFGGVSNNPEWIDDIFNNEFDDKYVRTLITEHMLETVDTSW